MAGSEGILESCTKVVRKRHILSPSFSLVVAEELSFALFGTSGGRSAIRAVQSRVAIWHGEKKWSDEFTIS